MAISRSQMKRQLYMGGGITQLPVNQMMVPRGQYGLGSIVKSITKPIKKAVSAVGDFAKSDVGKLALLAAGGYYLGGGQIPGLSKFLPAMKYGNAAGTGFGFGNILPNIANIAGFTGTADKLATMGTTGKTLLGIGGASVLSGLFKGNEQEAKAAFSRDPQGVKNYLVQYYKNLNKDATDEEAAQFAEEQTREYAAKGGIMGIPMGQPRENQQGVQELDYRKEGGFVPVGIKEKADDVPAMLSKNEFVFTADAVRGAGNGDVEKGAERLYNTMKTLENGGTV
jgi:hypothetical protein